MWLYGSGFPKSMNIGLAIDKKNGIESEIVGYDSGTMPDFRDVGKKQKEISGIDKLTFGQIENSERKKNPIYKATNKWQGWGTALKPSYEAIIVARKPLDGTCINNVQKWGVGGINIDECRIDLNGENRTVPIHSQDEKEDNTLFGLHPTIQHERIPSNVGRFPANTILTYDDTDYEEVCGGFPNTKKNGSIKNPNLKNSLGNNGIYNKYSETQPLWEAYNDSGSASRYFYCAKATRHDRDDGTTSKNIHTCVKPTSLMQYLVRLVTPKGGTILDPFMGSGSTGKAAALENNERNAEYKFIGIEKETEYCDIAKERIDYAINLKGENDNGK